MNDIVKAEREKRRKKRLRKKRQSTIVTITLLVIIASVGVVNAQTQGYQIFYHGESLGYVQTASVFESAVDRIQNSLGESYNSKNILLGDGFKLVPARLDNPMDFDAWVQVLSNKGIELYVKGTAVEFNGQEVGTMTSSDEAQRVIETFQSLYTVDSSKNGFNCIEKTVPLSETKDFATMLKSIKALKK